MREAFYWLTAGLARRAGLWAIRVPVWVITTFFFVFKAGPRRHCLETSRALFPERGGLYRLRNVWRRYHNFAGLFITRLRGQWGEPIPHSSTGREHILEVHREGKGGVLLMSHLGSWEAAAHLLKDIGVRVLLYLGRKEGERLEALQKKDLSLRGIKIVALAPGGDSPMDGLEALHWLRKGGFVGLAGDRTWTGERQVEVSFLGRRVSFPLGPHALAMAAEVPVFVFFCVEEGGGFQVVCSPPRWIKPRDRGDRQAALVRSVRDYARDLEAAVRRYPEQWYTFEPFLGPEWRE